FIESREARRSFVSKNPGALAMQPITREDVERFVEGDLVSPEDELRVEYAIKHDAQAAEWYEEIQASLAPSPAARQILAAEFERLARSTYANLRWQPPAGA